MNIFGGGRIKNFFWRGGSAGGIFPGGEGDKQIFGWQGGGHRPASPSRESPAPFDVWLKQLNPLY